MSVYLVFLGLSNIKESRPKLAQFFPLDNVLVSRATSLALWGRPPESLLSYFFVVFQASRNSKGLAS